MNVGLTEEQIIHTFSQVGNVVNFRLVYDRETGRPKGFGFAEYQDSDSAASAVRNLNDFEIMGRKLRVDFSHEGGEDDAAPAGYNPQPPQVPNGATPSPASMAQQGGSLPRLPVGVDLQPGVSCPDAISRILNTIPPSQLLGILADMKGLVLADPNKAALLLKEAPQLSYAIFQALLLLGLVDAAALKSVIEQPSAPPLYQVQSDPSQPQMNPSSLPLGQMSAPIPPTHGQPYQASAQSHQAPQQPLASTPVAAPMAPPPVNLDKASLLQYVLSLTEEQLNAMPPAERDQVLAIRQQIITGAIRL